MAKVIERVEACYDVQEVEFGKVYRWRPPRVVVECDCGERTVLERSDFIDSVTGCECGADHTAAVSGELLFEAPDKDEDAHPWRSSEDAGIPF